MHVKLPAVLGAPIPFNANPSIALHCLQAATRLRCASDQRCLMPQQIFFLGASVQAQGNRCAGFLIRMGRMGE